MSREASTYRGCSITYDPPPIPYRALDWAWVHPDYDGETAALQGRAASPEACQAEIDDLFEELEL